MSMSSETEVLKTNEFLRRRKLRLQQVREQSKDIAKKIRQRAKIEKLRQIVDLDSKKEKEYFQKQEKLVKRLEQLYAQGVKSVGDSHQKASEERHSNTLPEKDDLSKLRGKEAVAELRRKKQEKLDEQKRLLDRKLLAREAANEISRDKFSCVANKLQAKSSSKLSEEAEAIAKECPDGDVPKVTRIDMATQWDFEEIPNEWEPNVPALSLPRDDKESVKDSNNAAESKSDKSKRLDLFALSAEMPSSLRGGIPNATDDRSSIRPSLTLVSEYLQSRALRLRETDTTGSSKKQSDDLSNIKQTILRSRSSKIEAKGNIDKSTVSSAHETNLTKKNSVTMYNHSTRDSRDIPHGDSRLVVRDLQTDEDAYSQALKESTNENSKDKEQQKRLQEMRNKVAMTKQTVEKEYNETMSFLKSLPKEKCTKQMKNSYMDERRQKILKVSRQQKLQQEFSKIEKECRKDCENVRAKQQTIPVKTRKKSQSPAQEDFDNDFESRDLQYSWMPVPESDGNLAIHTIPNTLKEGKTGNTVKFSKVDSYHEYRSRHKHTPPTKDTNNDKQSSKRVVETVIIQKENDESTDCSSMTSDTSSVENMNLGKSNNHVPDEAISEADRIIIYKILNKKEKERKKLKLIDNVAKALKSMDKEQQNEAVSDKNNNDKEQNKRGDKDIEDKIPIDQVDEGVYKVVSEKGDNVASLYFSDNRKAKEGRNVLLTEDEQTYGRPCNCNKKLSGNQSEKGTNLHSGQQDLLGPRTGNCLGCKCGCASYPDPREQSNRVNSTIQPSAGTSISSFKTATTDKGQDTLPDGGFIKLLDNDGQEAGKFYIGASGFLKDDAYEVIIQLKKKEAMKTGHEDEKKHDALEKNVISKETQLKLNDLKEGDTSSHKLKNKSVIEITENIEIGDKKGDLHVDKGSQRVSSQISSLHAHDNEDSKEIAEIAQNSTGLASNVSINEPEPNLEPAKNLVDKGVHTSFQLSYAIPSHFPKTDIPRAATSTYTQTTMDSPNPRPVFIHMSSSTSTAYMSPPEMVLPNFMRNDYDFQGEKLKMTNPMKHCENYKCTRKRCKCHKTKSSGSCRKAHNDHILKPPPNTARDNDENSDTYDNEFELTSEHKCRKCGSRPSSAKKIQCQNYRKNRNFPLNKISSRNLVMRVSSSTASSFKNRINNLNNNKKGNKTDLNPLIKKYVNKLLELNKEGIKAIEVANQECSSVSTPGSSIIEVPRNLNNKESNVDHKISLEQMKNLLKQKILEEYVKENTRTNSAQSICNNKYKMNFNKISKKRSVHRVKSLNISKRLIIKQTDTRSSNVHNIRPNPSTSSPSSLRVVKASQPESVKFPNKKTRSKSSPTPRQYLNYEQSPNNFESDVSQNIDLRIRNINTRTKSNSDESSNRKTHPRQGPSHKINKFAVPIHRSTITSPDSELELLERRQENEAATNMSTQTSQDLDSEINLMKLAEDKLQNMEKIADLTEKCSKRLSNLAKVLEEVRRNKSLAYSQISTSDTASDSEHRAEKNASVNNASKQSSEPAIDVQDKIEHMLTTSISTDQEKEIDRSQSSEYVPFLTNIPKPAEFKYPASPITETVNTKSKQCSNTEGMGGRRREKPPPALSRIHLKHGHGQDIVPHELSTVVEVDSPMSVKFKNQSSTNTKCEVSELSNRINNCYKDRKDLENGLSTSTNTQHRENPDLLSNSNLAKSLNKRSSNDSSDDSKMQMMDLKQFNELMLKPFISIQEFAKQCGDVGTLDDASNLDDIPKDDGLNDELSSLHSDGSLPDVIAELLKRNIITEPFKFDTVSNVNSTTVSSESMMSVLALSKVKKDKKKYSVAFQNKGNASETSDSLSISSNPDLENAFKKLGMGWASSTLKKTKERLALSSSSNTSSSSLSQFKLKCLNDQDVPALVTDSILSSTKLSSKRQQEKPPADTSRNAEQQTSFMNSMTVKEFLTNELAKKITFTNKSTRNNSDDEFVSLFETKMPEELKHLSQSIREERSVDSVTSGQNNRARTSTPVQIFKSMTYQSSSSSNMSNGLFSNADDLSSVKVTSNSVRNHSTSDKDDLTIPNCSLKMRKGASDCSKSE